MNNIVKNLKKVGVFYIATVDGKDARVRPFASAVEFEGQAYICTGNLKEVYKQIKDNPNVEISGIYPDHTSWLRLKATLVEDNRLEVQKAILDDETGPKGLYEPGDGKFVTFKLTNIKAMKYSFIKAPEEIE